MAARNTNTVQAGRHASEMAEITKALDAAVGRLRHAIVRAVRSSTVEVDRRMYKRYAIDLPCRIEIPDQAPRTMSVADISEGGARLVNAPELNPGICGTLRLDGLAVPLAFKVLGAENGIAHLHFESEDAGQVALHGWLEAMAIRTAA